jgi:hypothetical protein
VNLRCRLLSLLRIHSPDCARCNAYETQGDELRKRLEEMNWRTLPPKKDVETEEVVMKAAISLKAGKRKKSA